MLGFLLIDLTVLHTGIHKYNVIGVNVPRYNKLNYHFVF